ncbi:hypothetical protein POM88_041345 [Heracleum sosnowskyi]|uniref:Uncharacterized protein n=1 Tax=Heracleum sosnowskyi TaxID=360622 RepID=A0AAD8HEL3_9APIA|nr:hypothetical protein POM88_041345 [Heracleum sosnowskyi]
MQVLTLKFQPYGVLNLKAVHETDVFVVTSGCSKQRVPHVLTVAGSDSGAGAGIQADLKACAARGVYCTTVITAVTAQNTVGVQGVNIVPERFVSEQLQSVLSDMHVDIEGILWPFKPICLSECTPLWHGQTSSNLGYGCPGLSITGSAIAYAEVARVDASFSTFIAVHSCLAMLTIGMCCWALTEPDYGSDASSLRTTTTKDQWGL